MKSQKIVLANSVGKDDYGFYIIHSPSRWSSGVKSLYNWFAYYPWELSYTSSLLKKYTDYKVKLIDPCLKRWDKKKTLNEIINEEPDWLIIESATRTIRENLWVAKKVKEVLGAKIIFVGQHVSAYPEKLLNQGIDYVCIGEYEYTVLELLQGEEKDKILGLYPNSRRHLLDINSLPFPEDEDVKRIEYGIPGEPSSEYLEIQAYASRGCFSNCYFCVARHLYYKQSYWRKRRVENIISEIEYLKNKYPEMEGIFFDEEVHNGTKDFILNLADSIKGHSLNNFKYEAMCDLRLFDEEMLERMHEAGYYKIRFGIETADYDIGSSIGKFIPKNALLKILKDIKKIGIKTYGTFMFGALNSSYEKDKITVKLIEILIKEGLLDNVQLSIATPQPGTPFYEIVKRNNWLRNTDWHKFDGENFSVIGYNGYNQNKIEELKREALLLRDHLYFKRKIRTKEFFSWIYFRYRKHGVKGVFVKFLKRIKIELEYLLKSYLSSLIKRAQITQNKNPV
jgi:radical SAM superfamily enzyme YgiQ (UPF0313 family)